MPDVVIVLCNETNWLVDGVQHIDALLAGTEAPEIDVEFVQIADWNLVIEKWGDPDDPSFWAIHPKIVQRLKDRKAARRFKAEASVELPAVGSSVDDGATGC